MKRFILCLCLLILFPSCCLSEQRVYISEYAGYLYIPEGYLEEIRENDSNSSAVIRSFKNFNDEQIQIAYQKLDSPLYSNAGELANLIDQFTESMKEVGENANTQLKISIKSCGECAAVIGEAEYVLLMNVINRYEVLSINAIYDNRDHKEVIIPFSIYPTEQPLIPSF